MRTLINYLRQIFCNHEWIVEEIPKYIVKGEFGETIRLGPKIYMRCKKCGYHKSHWKY